MRPAHFGYGDQRCGSRWLKEWIFSTFPEVISNYATRHGKICGTLMTTTAAMKYQSTFSTFKLQAVRSRPQERLVESLKRGLDIWILSRPSKRNYAISTTFATAVSGM